MEIKYFQTVIYTRENKEFLFPTLRICRVVSGDFDWKIGKEIQSLKSGDIVLLNNLTPRKILNSKADTLVIDVFEFSPAYIQARNLLLSMFYNENPIKLSVENQRLVNDLLSVITDAYNKVKKPIFFDHILQAIFELLEESSGEVISDRKDSIIAVEAINYIWAHYFEDISVLSVAKYLNISKSNLEKQFKNMHGIGVGAYIRIIRIYNVTARLKETPESSVLDVALSCGFSSSSGFYKAYKAVTGQKPRRK